MRVCLLLLAGSKISIVAVPKRLLLHGEGSCHLCFPSISAAAGPKKGWEVEPEEQDSQAARMARADLEPCAE